MNIINFKKYKPLLDVLKRMGANSNNEYSYKSDWKEITSEELLSLSSTGIELTIEEIEDCICEDGTFEWKGQKVIVYIKEQWVKYNNEEQTSYKYHVANCSTQIQMRSLGRIDRYVISTRNDGIFEITLRAYPERNIIEENICKNLDVCKNCLSTLTTYYTDKSTFFNFNNFSLKQFLESYNTRIHYLPRYSNNTAPLNEYPKNWASISSKYRESKNWKCEKCNLDCFNNRSFLHCHHVGLKYQNTPNKLLALCKDCHRKEPNHGMMY